MLVKMLKDKKLFRMGIKRLYKVESNSMISLEAYDNHNLYRSFGSNAKEALKNLYKAIKSRGQGLA